jgi:flavin-dependent dehydrogenase
MNGGADLVVIGAGPAGTAAAIVARERGLGVTLLERSPFPRHRPGETLHPGIEPVLRRLCVFEAVEALAPLRPFGVMTAWGARPRFVPYGADGRGPWRGFQVSRSRLDGVLLSRFLELGGRLVQPVADVKALIEHGKVCGVRHSGGRIEARAVIDASGAGGVLRRSLGLSARAASMPLVAHYGYLRGKLDDTPVLNGDGEGWTWIAQVETDLVHWTRLSFERRGDALLPPEVEHLPSVGRVRAANVTWRSSSRLAGDGWFIAGDAAILLDPSSSHGVLRALMTGMMAGQTVAETMSGRVAPDSAAQGYSAWMYDWFRRDTERMRDLYADLGAADYFTPDFRRAENPHGTKGALDA